MSAEKHVDATRVPGDDTQSPPLRRNPSFWLVVVLVLGAALRLWYLAYLVNAPDFRALRQDLDVQDYHARALVSGDWSLPDHAPADPEIREHAFYRPPGYPYFLACVYALSGGSYLAPRLLNMVLGMVSGVLWFVIGKRVFNPWVGVLAALLTTTYWGTVYYEGEVNDPALFQFLLPCIFLALDAWRARPSFRRAALAGLLIGCFGVMRPNIYAFGPIVALWMFWILLRRRETRRVLASWTALALGAFLLVLPITVRNYAVSGEFVPISTYFGENVLIGNGPESDGVTSWLPYLQQLEGTGQFSVWVYPNIVRGLAREIGDPDLKHGEASSIFLDKAVTYMREHKKRTLILAAKKAALFWSPLEITENKVVHYEKRFYPPLKYLPGFSMVFALLLFGSGWIAADFLQFRGRAIHANALQMLFLFFSFLLVYYATFLPFFVNARARVPLYGLCLLIGAYGLYRLAALLGERRWGRAFAGMGLLVAAWTFAATEWVPYMPDHARWHYARADSFLRDGRIEEALFEAEAMLALPEQPLPYMPFRLGHAFARLNRHEAAARLLTEALNTDTESQHPRYRQDLLYHIAAQLHELGRTDEALARYKEALDLNPSDPRVLNDLGVISDKQGQTDSAESYFRRAIAAAPDFALAHSNLGDLLARTGRMEEALTAFQRAVETAPGNADYRYNLARLLGETGRTDEALSTYRQTLELDPREPRALNNLGVLFMERGHAAWAARCFRGAIEADPAFPLPYANLADLLLRADDVSNARVVCETGLRQAPGSPALHTVMGVTLERGGDDDGARRHYENALELQPDYAPARAALEAL